MMIQCPDRRGRISSLQRFLPLRRTSSKIVGTYRFVVISETLLVLDSDVLATSVVKLGGSATYQFIIGNDPNVRI